MSNPGLRAANGEIHIGFVELLFALAAAQIGIEAADLVEKVEGFHHSYVEYLPAWFHLLLALIVIAASWVGWGKSIHGPRVRDIDSVFSLDFVELLLDVLLVVFYFILVRAVEKPTALGEFSASLRPEAVWMAVILCGYFAWDVVSKAWSRDSKRIDWETLRERAWASMVCAILAGVALYSLPTETSNHRAVVLGDVALVVLVFLFRVTKLQDRTKLARKHWYWIGGLCATFAILIAASNGFAR